MSTPPSQQLDELLRIAQNVVGGPQKAEMNKSWFFEQFREADQPEPGPTSGWTLLVPHDDTGRNVRLNLSEMSKFSIYLVNTLHRLTEPHLHGAGDNLQPNKSTESDIKVSKSAPTLNKEKPAKVMDIWEIQREELRAQKENKAKRAQQREALSPPACGIDNWNASNIGVTSTPSKAVCDNSWSKGNRSLGNRVTPQRAPSDAANRQNRSLGSGRRGRFSGPPAAATPCLGDFIVVAPKRNQQQLKKKKQAQQQQQQQKPAQKKRVELQTISGGAAKRAPEPEVQAVFRNAVEADGSLNPADDRKTLNMELSQLRGSDAKNGGDLSTDGAWSPAPKAVPLTFSAALQQTVTPRTADYVFKVISSGDRLTIEALAQIYSILIDLNLCTNVLSEIGFMLNLLNSPKRRTPGVLERAIRQLNSLSLYMSEDDDKFRHSLSASLPNIFLSSCCRQGERDEHGALRVLDNFTNTLYFAYHVLRLQLPQLALLDVKTVGIVLDTVRQYGGDLCEHLLEVYETKVRLNVDDLMADGLGAMSLGESHFQSVLFDEECDSRHNFASTREFSAFKKQRDIFYAALKRWGHTINSDQTFSAEIVPMIQNIFKTSQSTINMGHLARLVVAQLLVTLNSRAAAATTVEDIGVDISVPKLNRLMQRLVQTGAFNQEDNFPGKQEFFRKFIHTASSENFRCQLKLALFAELISLQDKAQGAALKEPGVPCSDMACIMVLAKFLGYVTGLPFNDRPATLNDEVEEKQLALRNLFQTDFDLSALLLEAVHSNKLIVTLPWVIQYLVMLDMLALKLRPFKKVVALICGIYLEMTTLHCSTSRDKQPATTFILRTCIGWLFEEKPYLMDCYHSYVSHQNASICVASDYTAVSCGAPGPLSVNSECLITVACPFLGKFRSTLQSEHKKGPFRHVATQWLQPLNVSVAHVPSAEDRDQADQQRLVEAFMQSLNPSKRKLVDFLVERIYKAVIKNAQLTLLGPAKATADAEVNKITEYTFTSVRDRVTEIYQAALEECLSSWPMVLETSLDERVPLALDVLLPTDMTPSLKAAYVTVTKRLAEAKACEWRDRCLIKTNFLCENIDEVALKITECNKGTRRSRRVPDQSTVIAINALRPCMSDYMHELQRWLHMTSLRIDQVDGIEGILACLKRMPEAFVHKFPTVLYYLLTANVIQLTHNLLANRPLYVKPRYIDAICDLLAQIEGADSVLQSNKHKTKPSGVNMPGPFDTLVTSIAINTFGEREDCFDKFEQLLIAMLGKNLITFAFLGDNFMAVLKTEWPPKVLQLLSVLMRNLSQVVCCGGQGNDEKSRMYLEMLADWTSVGEDFS